MAGDEDVDELIDELLDVDMDVDKFFNNIDELSEYLKQQKDDDDENELGL